MGTTRRARGGVALFLIGRLVARLARAGTARDDSEAVKPPVVSL